MEIDAIDKNSVVVANVKVFENVIGELSPWISSAASKIGYFLNRNI